MTIQQTGAVMDVLTVAYPQFYRGKDQRERQNALKLWAEMFSEDPLELVLAAVKRLIATDTKGYPPPIGAVKEQIWQVQHPQQMTEQEAWRLVAKAVNTADAERSFAALPPEVQQAVGSPVQLAEWGRMEETAFQSVVASNFQRAFRSRSQQQREQDKLPNSLRPGPQGRTGRVGPTAIAGGGGKRGGREIAPGLPQARDRMPR